MARAIQKENIIKYRAEIIVFAIFLMYLLILRIVIPISNGRLLPSLSYIPLGEGFADWDYFVMMSRDIFSIFKGEIVEPFCYRPLIPLIAGLLPFNLEISYSLITLISIYLTGIMLYFTLRLKFNKMLSIFGLVMFCFLSYLPPNWIITQYSFFHVELFMIYLVDVEAWLIIICCFYCILSSKKMGYAFFLVLGILIKEVVLFTIPVFLIYELLENDRNEGKRKKFYSFLKATQYIVPGILTYLLMHFIVVPQPTSEVLPWYQYYGENDYGSIGMILEFIRKRIDQIINDPLEIFRWTIGIWGIPLVILWFFNKKSDFIYWLKLYGIFIILVYLQLFWGMAEGKYIDLAFFPMIFLAVSGLNNTSIIINNKIEDAYGASVTKRLYK
jgi:hypothetical protein